MPHKSESGGSADEANKRRRSEEEEEGTPFKRCPKTQRTPTKRDGDKMAEIQRQILENTNRMMEEMKNIRKELEDVRRENEEMKKAWEAREKVWEQERERMIEKIEYLEYKNEMRERSERRNNIVIKGMEIKKGEERRLVEEFVKKNMEIEIKPKDVLVQGNGMVIVKMGWEEKREIMRNKNKLKGKNGAENIFLDDDLTRKEREIQKELRRIAKEEKEKKKDVKVGYQKIRVEGEWHKWDKDGKYLRKFRM